MARKKTKEKPDSLPDFGRNMRLYYVAVAVLFLGYFILSIGGANSFTSLTLGPIVLVVGYLVAIPVALLSGVRPKRANGDGQSNNDPKSDT